MINKIKDWLYWNAPIITTRKEQEKIKQQNKWLNKVGVRPAIHSLFELRNNTWDKGRVDRIIKYLRDTFEVQDD